MRRAVVTASATAAGIILLLSLKPHAESSAAAGSSKVISSGDSGSDSSSSSSSSSSQSSPLPSPSSSAAANGSTRTVTGDAIDTRYGPVQVRITLSGKKITKVDVLQYPSEGARDMEISSAALPELNQEAIAAQSAQIDAVSGATFTSDGYTRSLQSALDKAKS